MAAAPSYRFNAVVTLGSSVTRLVGEYQAPDRLHEVVTAPGGGGADVIFVGPQPFVLDPRSGRWTKGRPGAPLPDPRQAFRVLDSAEHVEASGGTLRFELPVRAARQLNPGRDASAAPVAGEAVAAPGGLAHLGFTLNGGPHAATVTVDYRDIGTAPPVTQPAAS